MIKTLETAIEKIRTLPADRQAYAAEILEQLAAGGSGVHRVPDDHMAAIQEGIGQADRREFVSDADMQKLWKHCGQ